MEKGIAKGMEKGLKQKELEIAKKLLNKKMNIEEIVEITGLSKEELMKI